MTDNACLFGMNVCLDWANNYVSCFVFLLGGRKVNGKGGLRNSRVVKMCWEGGGSHPLAPEVAYDCISSLYPMEVKLRSMIGEYLEHSFSRTRVARL